MDREIKRRKWGLKRASIPVGSAALIAAVVWGLVTEGNGESLRVPAEHILISTVEEGEFQEYVPLTATVVPLRTHYLDATEGGRVEAVYREAGSFVEAGDEILKLANTSLLLDVMYREAELFQQSNNLRNTKIAMEQNRLQMRTGDAGDSTTRSPGRRAPGTTYAELSTATWSPGRTMKSRSRNSTISWKSASCSWRRRSRTRCSGRSQAAQLEESLERMQSNLAVVKQNLDNLVIRAPISGQLTALNAEIGQSRRAGSASARSTSSTASSCERPSTSTTSPGSSAGSAGNLTVFRRHLRARDWKVYPQVVQGRFEVDLDFDGDGARGSPPRPDLRLRLELGDPVPTRCCCRTAGFYQATGGRWVYVVDDSGNEARRREIVVGRQNAQLLRGARGARARRPGDHLVLRVLRRRRAARSSEVGGQATPGGQP